MKIKLQDKDYHINKTDGESDKIFLKRIEFLKKVFDDTSDINYSISLSKIWLYYTFKKCKYSPEVFYKIKKYLL